MVSSRSRLSRGRSIGITLTGILLVTAGLYVPVTLLTPAAAATSTITRYSIQRAAPAVLSWPSSGASAIGVRGYPATELKSGDSSPLPIASISKIITTLVVLQAKPLASGSRGPTITFTAADAALRAKYTALDGETAPLAAGSSISQLDLMKVALVASANNYADALSTWAYGSPNAFITAVKAWLVAHHLTHTTIVEPTGINPANVSTASDLVTLGQLALANPVVASIVKTQSLNISGIGHIVNTNTLLGTDGIVGIKTGTLGTSSNLLFASDLSLGGTTVTIVGAVIGARSHSALNSSVTALLDSVIAGFHAVELAHRGQSFATYTTPWSSPIDAVATQDSSILVWSDEAVVTTVRPARLLSTTAMRDGGSAQFTVGTRVLSLSLSLTARLPEPDAYWRLSHPFGLSG